jgi:hypothetical protein
MSMRRDASDQMIAVVGGGSAAGGVATATGTVAAVVDGVAVTYEQLVPLGPEVVARLIAAGKLTQETIQRLSAVAPQLMTQAGNYLFARGGQGLLNGRFTGDRFRLGYSWSGSAKTAAEVFRMVIGSKRTFIFGQNLHWRVFEWKR